jgi:hypothetical protein
MNEELLATSAFFVKVAPYWSVTMVSSTFLQLSNVTPIQVCSAPAAKLFNNTGGTSKGILTSILPLKKPKDY